MQIPINTQNEDQDMEQRAADLLARIQDARNSLEEKTGQKIDQLAQDTEKAIEDNQKMNEDIAAFLMRAAEDMKKNDEAFDAD